jgi:hypothetical protein
MVWFFHRNRQYLRCEVRTDREGSRYELLLEYPDGTVTVEQFDDDSSLTARWTALQHRLHQEGWDGPHGRPH